MLNWSLIAGFDWDEGNRQKSLDKHAVSAREAEEVFVNQPLLITEDLKHSKMEIRLQALGQTHLGRRLHIAFTLREDNTKIRVISAREMNRKEKERALYEQEV
jgi:uncharacterized DUF497 family protein